MSGGFGIEHLPYGVDRDGHVLVRHGDTAIDLALLDGLDVPRDVWRSGSLNAFMALGRPAWQRTRGQISAIVSGGSVPDDAVRACDDVELVLPFAVADYVDFYSSEQHATTMSRILRPDGDRLPAAWKHLPIGYHGRSSTVVVSGSAIPRPHGVLASPGGPAVGPSARLDVEVELGFVVGTGSERGRTIAADAAADHVFGLVILNDWSARDIQAFEYQPLGPFLGKSFATSISAWVTPLDALARSWVPGPVQEPAPAPYLCVAEPRGLDVALELELNGTVISSMSAAGLYWSMAQQLAHVTANGASASTGDLFGTGTISDPGAGHAGSLMEMTWAGERPITLADGSTRGWLADGDTVTIRGGCGDGLVTLGEVTGTVVVGRS